MFPYEFIFLMPPFNVWFIFNREKVKCWVDTLCWKCPVQKYFSSILTVRKGRSHLYCLQHEFPFFSWWFSIFLSEVPSEDK